MGKVDSGDKGGDRSKAEGSKMSVEEGKFNDKKWEGYGRERGKGVCEVCRGNAAELQGIWLEGWWTLKS